MSTAYLFPGQGSQSVGMGHDLYEQDAAARDLFDEADRLLGISLTELCFSGPDEALTDTVNQQPALFVTSLATLAAMQANGWGGSPSFMAGHSLGELSALTAAGAIPFADGLGLVRKRGELMKRAGNNKPGGMAAILGLDILQVEAICDQAKMETGTPIQIANDNCPGQAVISGDEMALERAIEAAIAGNARKVVRLPITIAAHSPLMDNAAAEFAKAVQNVAITLPQTPVIGNRTARPLQTVDAIRQELVEGLTGAVRWTETIQWLAGQGVDRYIEVGAGKTLSGLVRRIHRRSQRLQFQLQESV